MIEMRVARIEDLDDVFVLANDPVVRAASFSEAVIPYQDHIDWFRKIIKDPSCLFLLFHEGQRLIGQIRFSIESDEAEVSVSIASEYRGKGFGQSLLNMAMERLRAERKCLRVLALVKPENEASSRFFKKCGFQELSERVCDGNKREVWVLLLGNPS